MTEAEVIESLYSIAASTSESVSLYITCVTGYLVAAYFIGRDLTRFQVAVISVLFVVFALSFVGAIQTGLANMVAVTDQYPVQIAGWANFASKPFNMVLLVVDSVGVIVCLMFMWNIRHTKKEELLPGVEETGSGISVDGS